MRIIHIAGRQVQGQSFDHDLTRPVVVFTGQNGAGKTTRLKVIEMALRGPGKQDSRLGEKASVHLRLEVPATVHPGGRVEVLRGLTPKHTLALQPLVAQGSKSLSSTQGQLDAMTQMVPAVFDLRAFTGLSAEKQKAALLPYATHVPATGYAHLYEAVPPFEGEAGSDYLGRVSMAIRDEINALNAKRQNAEKASLELANKDDSRSLRAAAQIRSELAALDATVAGLRQCVGGRAAVNDATTRLRTAMDDQERIAAAVPPDVPPPPARGSDEIRAQLNEADKVMRAWNEAQQFSGRVAQMAQDVERARADTKRLQDQLQALGCDAPAEDVDVLQRQLAEVQTGLAEASRLTAEADRLRRELAAAAPAQLFPRALLARALGAAVAGQVDSAALVLLRAVLEDSGYPSTATLQESLRRSEDARQGVFVPFNAESEVQTLPGRIAQAQRVQIQAQTRKSIEGMVAQAQAQEAQATATWQGAAAQNKYDPAGHHEAATRAQGLQAELSQVIAIEQRRAGVAAQAQALDQARNDVHARVKALGEALQQVCATNAAQLAAAQVQVSGLDQALAQTEAARPALQAELDTAIRAEGKLQAEQAAFADAEQAKARVDLLKDLDKRIKEAADDCLRQSMGKVAEAFQPFAALLGAQWRLGVEAPLGLDRNGQWISYENLSDSEQLVFGIGLVLALSTLGQGLRVVLLDNLDACDTGRRAGIAAVAAQLVHQGRLDQVIGTAWSPEGFWLNDNVQVVEVRTAA